MKLFLRFIFVATLAKQSLASSRSSEQDHHDILGAARRLQQLPPGVAPEIGIIGASIAALTPPLGKFETPITARYTHYYDSIWWNCIAVYSAEFMDSLTRARPTIVVADTSLHSTANRAACGAQAIATYNSLSLPDSRAPFVATMQAIGVPVVDGMDPDLAACADQDTTCYQNVAASKGYSPGIMGNVVARQVYDHSIQDGFNELGKDDGCQVSCRPFRDTTGFCPANYPCEKDQKKKNKNGLRSLASKTDAWEPLLEDDGSGFFYYHQHVTPHIGEKANFITLPENERTKRVAPAPTYKKDRSTEALAVISKMATLTDGKKVQVELFDDKIAVIVAIINSFIGKVLTDGYDDKELGQPGLVLTYERLLHFVVGLTGAELDSIIVAWKNKVDYDLIRPTTVIKRWGDVPITTWTPDGIKTFPARDFEAYKRVMPHSEYVSGSACIFETFKDYVVGYMTTIGLETTFPVRFDPFPAGSSSVETGVPKEDITLQYPSIELMAAAGSESRLDGGMHFEESVPAALEVCSGIGNFANDFVVQLLGV